MAKEGKVAVFQVRCPCGQEFPARVDQVGERAQCPACARWLKLEKWTDSQTLVTRIRVIESRLNQLPALSKAVPANPASAVQDILCNCEESLHVETPKLGTETQCPACGTTLRLGMRRDPETSLMVVVPEIVSKAEPPEKQGIDEEVRLDDFK